MEVCGAWKPKRRPATKPSSECAELIDRRLNAGAEVVELEIRGEVHPLAPLAGMFKDDPLLQPWKEAMEEYRRTTEDDL